MIRSLKPTEFDSFYSLLEASLPPDEFRARDDQRRALVDPAFCPYVLVDAQEAVRGLVTVWDFDGFAFIEHLAVAPELRCGGLGSALLQDAFARRPKRFCLEVDPPETALARRRIAFYERNGLSLNADYPYIQPSLGAGRSSEGSARPHPRHGLRACLPALVIKCKKAASNDFPKSFEAVSFDIFGIFAYSVSSSASADTPPVSARHLAVNAVTCSGHLPM